MTRQIRGPKIKHLATEIYMKEPQRPQNDPKKGKPSATTAKELSEEELKKVAGGAAKKGASQ
jgi:bacteriocin-like protein